MVAPMKTHGWEMTYRYSVPSQRSMFQYESMIEQALWTVRAAKVRADYKGRGVRRVQKVAQRASMWHMKT